MDQEIEQHAEELEQEIVQNQEEEKEWIKEVNEKGAMYVPVEHLPYMQEFNCRNYNVTVEWNFLNKISSNAYLESSHIVFYMTMFKDVYRNFSSLTAASCHFFADFASDLSGQINMNFPVLNPEPIVINFTWKKETDKLSVEPQILQEIIQQPAIEQPEPLKQEEQINQETTILQGVTQPQQPNSDPQQEDREVEELQTIQQQPLNEQAKLNEETTIQQGVTQPQQPNSEVPTVQQEQQHDSETEEKVYVSPYNQQQQDLDNNKMEQEKLKNEKDDSINSKVIYNNQEQQENHDLNNQRIQSYHFHQSNSQFQQNYPPISQIIFETSQQLTNTAKESNVQQKDKQGDSIKNSSQKQPDSHEEKNENHEECLEKKQKEEMEKQLGIQQQQKQLQSSKLNPQQHFGEQLQETPEEQSNTRQNHLTSLDQHTQQHLQQQQILHQNQLSSEPKPKLLQQDQEHQFQPDLLGSQQEPTQQPQQPQQPQESQLSQQPQQPQQPLPAPKKEWIINITSTTITPAKPQRQSEKFLLKRLPQLLEELATQNGITTSDICKQQFLYFPINLNQSHWVSVVIKLAEQEVYYFDSYYSSIDLTVKEGINIILKNIGFNPTYFKWITYYMKQDNGNDCGIFMLLSLLYTYQQHDYDYNQYIASQYRKIILHDLAVVGSQIKIPRELFEKIIKI